MSRTSNAREHLFALYRSGSATVEELAAAHRAYDDAATADGVQAVVDAIGALTDEQRRVLALILTPNPTSQPHPRRPNPAHT